MKNKAATWLIRGLFVLLIASFGVWGIGDFIRGRDTVPAVANVGGIDILAPQLQREFDRTMRQMRSYLGEEFDVEQAKQLGLVDSTLAQIVTRTLYDAYAQQLGLSVSDAQLLRRVQSDPNFLDATGQFDKNRLLAFLDQIRLSEAAFAETVKHDIMREQVANAVAIGVALPDALRDPLYAYRAETRAAETIIVESGKMPEPAAPDEAALRAFHESHAERYQAPEYRSRAIARLAIEDFAGEIAVSDEALQAAYDERAGEYQQPERRSVEQMVFLPDEKTKAEEAATRLAAGEAFADVAQALTGKAPIALGTLEQTGFVSDMSALGDAAFATELGMSSAPVETPIGWHILHVLTVEPASTISLDEAKAALTADLQREYAVDALIAAGNALDDAIAGGATLEDAAAAVGAKIESAAAVDFNGLDPEGKPVGFLVADPSTLQLAFATEAGESTTLREDVFGGFFMLRVDGVTPPATRSFEQVQDQVRSGWIADQKDQAAAAKAAELAAAISGGGDLAASAAALGVEIKRTIAVRRDGQDLDNNLTPELASGLFALAPGQAISGSVPGGYAVARLAEIYGADAANDQPGLDALGAELKAGVIGDILEQFGAALNQEIGVEIDQDALAGAI